MTHDDIDTAAIREWGLREDSSLMLYRTLLILCDALDTARENAADLATIVERMGAPVINTISLADLTVHLETLARAEKAEAIIEACGCNSEAGWAANEKFRSMAAAIARVEEVLAEYIEPGPDWVLSSEEDFNHGVDRAVERIRAALRGSDD